MGNIVVAGNNDKDWITKLLSLQGSYIKEEYVVGFVTGGSSHTKSFI